MDASAALCHTCSACVPPIPMECGHRLCPMCVLRLVEAPGPRPPRCPACARVLAPARGPPTTTPERRVVRRGRGDVLLEEVPEAQEA